MSSCTGSYAGSALPNYIARPRAWYILHDPPWPFNKEQLKSTFTGTAKVAPTSSRKLKQETLTIDILKCILGKLDHSKPLDAAIAGCITTSFYSVSWTTEFTQKTLNSFNPASHIKPSDITLKTNHNSLNIMVFTLPKTKCSNEPKDTYWSNQESISDPEKNFQNSLTINTPPPDGPLFAFKHAKGHKPLTRKVFLDSLNEVSTSINLGPLKGHSLRIRGTLEFLLLQGVLCEIMRSLRCWKSNDFILYLCQHTVILPPYIQNSSIFKPFTHYTMPQGDISMVSSCPSPHIMVFFTSLPCIVELLLVRNSSSCHFLSHIGMGWCCQVEAPSVGFFPQPFCLHSFFSTIHAIIIVASSRHLLVPLKYNHLSSPLVHTLVPYSDT